MAFSISVTKNIPGLSPTGAGLQKYSNAYVIVEGLLLAQEASMSIDKDPKSKVISTLHRGFAGVSLGPGVAEITIENAVPSKDFEFKPDFFLRTGQTMEVGIVMASRQTLAKGFVVSANYTHKVDDVSTLSFKMVCRLVDFE